MISANELRIGNYAAFKTGKAFQIQLFHINKISCNKTKFYGIPITEEWLLKFGAKLSNGNVVVGFDLYEVKQDTYWYQWQGFTIVQWGLNTPYFYINHRTKIEIKSVHQLQNLYFALTQTELETK